MIEKSRGRERRKSLQKEGPYDRIETTSNDKKITISIAFFQSYVTENSK